ncbi:MAG TPA: ShlB/FhaC/HecB family hemolysin secretion/activation protein [Rhodocyclaceae bacterium]
MAAAAVPAAQQLRVPILHWAVEGNTLLPEAAVESVLAPYLAPDRGLDDIRAAQRALEAAYRRAGYGTVSVILPEQEIGSGTVRLRVVEGRIGRVDISGNRHFDAANLRASLPALREGATPNLDSLDANVQLSNENPAKHVGVALAAGSETAGIDARVEVEDHRPQRFGASIDNTGTVDTGRTRLALSYQHANLWNRDHVVSAQFLTSLEHADRIKVVSAGYRAPFYEWNSAVDVFAARSDVSGVSTPTTAGLLSFGARGSIVGVRYNAYLPRIGGGDQKLIVGIDRRAYDNACTLGDFGAAGCGAAAASITVRPASIAWAGQWLRPGFRGSASVGYTRNLPGGANGSAADFAAARSGADAAYDLWRAGAQAGIALPADLLLQGMLDVQQTRHALVPGEQFGLGGAGSVRGFDERAVANDNGYRASIELYTPELAGRLKLPGSLRLLAFHDAGGVTRNHALPGEEAHTRLASVGIGGRYALGRDAFLRFDIAHATRTDGHDAQKQQAHLSLQVYF